MRALSFLVSCLVVVGCSGGVVSVSGDGGSSSSDGGSSADGSLPDGASADGSTSRDGGAGADGGSGGVCKVDAECNDDPGISRLLGKCFQGICICGPGSWVQPSGRCGLTQPPACQNQGGTCHQNPAECPQGNYQGTQTTNMTCGDLVPAVCCFQQASCKGPDFNCCLPNDGIAPPLCENGWRTCGNGATPVLPGGTCGG